MKPKLQTGERHGAAKPGRASKLVASGVRVSRGGVEILAGVDLAVESGEFVALIGPSGAGKSTLLGVLSGLDAPDAGTVEKDGEPLARPDLISYMPQSDGLLPWRSVLANAALGLEATGVPRRQARTAALEALKRFGLADFAGVSPTALSGGMRSRVALLRTALLGRDVLLLDEPFGALDALTRRDLRTWLLEVREELAATIVLVTHDVDEALLLADRVVVLSRRPARVAAEVRVPFESPRSGGIETTAEFARLKGRLISLLGGEGQ
ncbi:ABC-type nitrate/sulfonate/bicarbonate transport system ATPase component [Rubrobacter radiotolerans]|uniref:ABC-type nitrate/sulfonate/bicarbonate transport system ATPase component n=1 Tax=Rubrobacter radiotolerans TaxID=42256 RepID=A0A023X6M4_RUBRA|nr:ABC-type nitrate/sulfonate/bicarbonate transport system ATPase component [Rubrobacter radiotolerans]SMC07498.1 ABC-type nitrate/sulfonate/bicarbonate transport system, ATPase component [Rubrobacter radiotolerans DSM 5868]